MGIKEIENKIKCMQSMLDYYNEEPMYNKNAKHILKMRIETHTKMLELTKRVNELEAS